MHASPLPRRCTMVLTLRFITVQLVRGHAKPRVFFVVCAPPAPPIQAPVSAPDTAYGYGVPLRRCRLVA